MPKNKANIQYENKFPVNSVQVNDVTYLIFEVIEVKLWDYSGKIFK